MLPIGGCINKQTCAAGWPLRGEIDSRMDAPLTLTTIGGSSQGCIVGVGDREGRWMAQGVDRGKKREKVRGKDEG